ncbi:MAG: glycosyltransferase, partial [Candidatus Sulfotelmatobacter sp.]
MEAASMMRPVVASDIRGCREVVLNGDTGLLVPPRDVPRLVQAIETLHNRRELAARMGERARQHIINNFNSKDVCGRLCEFYAQLAGGERTVAAGKEPAYHRS